LGGDRGGHRIQGGDSGVPSTIKKKLGPSKGAAVTWGVNFLSCSGVVSKTVTTKESTSKRQKRTLLGVVFGDEREPLQRGGEVRHVHPKKGEVDVSRENRFPQKKKQYKPLSEKLANVILPRGRQLHRIHPYKREGKD